MFSFRKLPKALTDELLKLRTGKLHVSTPPLLHRPSPPTALPAPQEAFPLTPLGGLPLIRRPQNEIPRRGYLEDMEPFPHEIPHVDFHTDFIQKKPFGLTTTKLFKDFHEGGLIHSINSPMHV